MAVVVPCEENTARFGYGCVLLKLLDGCFELYFKGWPAGGLDLDEFGGGGHYHLS